MEKSKIILYIYTHTHTHTHTHIHIHTLTHIYIYEMYWKAHVVFVCSSHKSSNFDGKGITGKT